MVNGNKRKSSKKTGLRVHRIFSEDIRKQTVKDIELGRCTVLEASRELQVSEQSIYNWLGRKQLEMDLLNKVIELANEEYGTDLKKNSLSRHLNGTGSIKGSNTDTK